MGIWSSSSLMMQLATHSSLLSGHTNSNYTSLMITISGVIGFTLKMAKNDKKMASKISENLFTKKLYIWARFALSLGPLEGEFTVNKTLIQRNRKILGANSLKKIMMKVFFMDYGIFQQRFRRFWLLFFFQSSNCFLGHVFWSHLKHVLVMQRRESCII